MQKKEFMDLLKLGGVKATRAPASKADWESIITEASATDRSYTIAQVHRDLVKGVVSRGRVRGKLNDLFEKEQVARLLIEGAYHYCFSPEAIAQQHGE